MSELRVAVVGAGFGAKVHLPGFQLHPATRLVAAVTRRPDVALDLMARYGLAVFPTLEDLLEACRVDLVSIATPVDTHVPLARQALEAGAGVLLEKPLGLSAAEGEELLALARSKGRISAINFEKRFEPSWQLVRSLATGGVLGRLQSLTVTWFGSAYADPMGRGYGWTSEVARGGGQLGARASHLFDAVSYLFEEEITAVTALLDTMVPERLEKATGQMRSVTAEDSLSVLGRLQGGGRFAFTLSMVAWHGGGLRIEAHGDEGSVLLLPSGEVQAGLRGRPLRTLPVPRVFQQVPAVVPKGGDRLLPPFLRLLDKLVTDDPELPRLEDGLRVQRVMDAVRASHGHLRPVGP